MGQDNQPLAPVFQEIYHSRKPLYARGQFKAAAGEGLLSRLVAFMIGIPVCPDYKPAALFIDRKANHEVWYRNFGGKKFSTLFYNDGVFNVEQLFFLRIYFKMIFGRSVYYEMTHIAISKIRLAGFVKITSNNYATGDREWDFEVIIQTRKSNLIFKYWGSMKISDEALVEL